MKHSKIKRILGMMLALILCVTILPINPIETSTSIAASRLADVAFSSEGGAYIGPVTIELSHENANAAIYYTLDGSQPTKSSALYSGPITISSSGTLKAIAIAEGYYSSYVKSESYNILTTLEFKETNLSLKEFKTKDLKTMLLVGEGTCDGIIWSSSTPEIAEVDSEGILTAKKQGGTVITASSKNGTTTQCTVMITAPTISITKSKTLKINKSTTLSIKPENYRTRVKWTSSNKKIATVNQKGKLVAKAPGTCTITATYGNQKKKCKITVPKVKIKLNAKKITVGYKKVKNLKVTTNLDKNLIKWKTSNSKVAKIGSNGKIIPMGAGTCKIIAYYKKYKASCTVKIPSSVVKVSAPKKLATKWDVYYDYIEKHNIQIGDCLSLKLDWSKVAHASGYEVKIYWRGDDNCKETQTVNIIKQNGKYYYSSVSSGIYHTGIYKAVKDLVYHTEYSSFSSKKLSFCVKGGTSEDIYKVSIRSYKTINGKRFYSKTKTKKV